MKNNSCDELKDLNVVKATLAPSVPPLTMGPCIGGRMCGNGTPVRGCCGKGTPGRAAPCAGTAKPAPGRATTACGPNGRAVTGPAAPGGDGGCRKALGCHHRPRIMLPFSVHSNASLHAQTHDLSAFLVTYLGSQVMSAT